jgi:hemerythrin-like metal-binding protein
VVDIVGAGFESGNKQIDNQHLALFAVANVLMDEISHHEPVEVIHGRCGDSSATSSHFQRRGKLHGAASPALLTSHRAAHFKLLQEARRLSEALSQELASRSELVAFVVHDMVADHLAKEDKLFLPVLRGRARAGA